MECKGKIKPSWIKVEMEHTKNPAVARKIACDHYKEFGNAYYPALMKMERMLRRKK